MCNLKRNTVENMLHMLNQNNIYYGPVIIVHNDFKHQQFEEKLTDEKQYLKNYNVFDYNLNDIGADVELILFTDDT